MDYNKISYTLLPFIIFINIIVSPNLVLADSKVHQKNSSEVVFYGRLWAQYDISDNSTSNNNKVSSIRDDEGNGRIGIKGKSFISNGYILNYKIEYAMDIGDSWATSDSTNCNTDANNKSPCNTFVLKQGWLGLLTPFGQFKFGSLESPYKYLAKHDLFHDTISQARDTRMISQGAMAHSSYWRESMLYELKLGDLNLAFIYGFGEGTSNNVTKQDTGIGVEYKNLFFPGLSIAYANNHDNSINSAGDQDYNEKYTITKNFNMEGNRRIKIWYMHEDIGLDSKMFTGGNSDGEVDWYGIRYKTGPMELQYSYGATNASQGASYDRDGYNIGMKYKLSKTSSIYLGHSASDAGSGDGVNQDIESTMIGLRYDF